MEAADRQGGQQRVIGREAGVAAHTMEHSRRGAASVPAAHTSNSNGNGNHVYAHTLPRADPPNPLGNASSCEARPPQSLTTSTQITCHSPWCGTACVPAACLARQGPPPSSPIPQPRLPAASPSLGRALGRSGQAGRCPCVAGCPRMCACLLPCGCGLGCDPLVVLACWRPGRGWGRLGSAGRVCTVPLGFDGRR